MTVEAYGDFLEIFDQAAMYRVTHGGDDDISHRVYKAWFDDLSPAERRKILEAMNARQDARVPA